jgi:hypothetical protein
MGFIYSQKWGLLKFDDYLMRKTSHTSIEEENNLQQVWDLRKLNLWSRKTYFSSRDQYKLNHNAHYTKTHAP